LKTSHFIQLNVYKTFFCKEEGLEMEKIQKKVKSSRVYE